MDNYQQIVWLSSWPKSGSTWLRCFLDAYFTGESDINDILISINDNKLENHQVDNGPPVSLLPSELQILTRPTALLRVVRAYNEMGADIPLFIKTHAPNSVLNGVDLMPFNLTKRIVHLVRDPRDVVASWAKHAGLDIEAAIDQLKFQYLTIKDNRTDHMNGFVGSWDNHVNSMGTLNYAKTFRYEDMRSDPTNTFSRILEHMAVPVDRERVTNALDLVSLSKLQEQEKRAGFAESSPFAENKFFGKGEITAGKGKITDAQGSRIVRAFRKTMKRLNYI